jgi:ABC-type nitrate/sulfonate/bicarbonate transport system ATPase subunit
MSILDINNLSISYGKTVAVESISLELDSETAVLFGPSGCGKTSILKAILGVNESGMKVEGTINFNGVAIKKGTGEIGMVFQGPVVPTWMRLYDLCLMGCNIRNQVKDTQKQRIFSMLRRFNIEHLYNQFPDKMSGGEKQRSALAITLVNNPKILLLDEPTTFIDGINRIAIWKYVEDLVKPLGIPIIIVCHDPIEAITLGDVIYVLSKPAKLIKTVKVPFPHPRTDELSRTPEFWEIKRFLAL